MHGQHQVGGRRGVDGGAKVELSLSLSLSALLLSRP